MKLGWTRTAKRELGRVLDSMIVRRDYDPQRIREGYPAGWPAFASM